MADLVCEVMGGGPDSCEAVCCREPKWAAQVDDKLVPMPRQRVLTRLLKVQAGVAEGRTLLRDHNSPDDVVLGDEQEVDLAEGNVFYSLSACDVVPRCECRSPAKLAWVVDDRVEVTTRPGQSGQSLRDLFGLASNSVLVRDYEGPNDEVVEIAESIAFAEGPVFRSRAVVGKLQITVNARLFTEADGVTREMLGKAVAGLVYPDNPDATRVFLVSDGNREIALGEVVRIRGCEVFDVVRRNVDGGYEAARVERELALVREGGQSVTLLVDPQSSVIYHALRTRPGHPTAATDVLVPVPGGYPGQMLDWAYLPDDSLLIGKVKGSAQDSRISAGGRVWRQISYHPHTNGGGPPWDPAKHGFHTYLGELLSWLYAAN